MTEAGTTPWHRRRSLEPDAGFLLIEGLIAITLVGVALLLPLSLLAQDVRVSARIEAQHRVRAELQTIIELLRVGVVRLESGAVEPTALWDVAEPTGARYWLEVSKTTTPYLFHVHLVSRHQVQGMEIDQSITTLVWYPP